MLAITFAFIAGLVTILSPCILPMVPLVLATGAGGGKWRPVGVALGLGLSFTAATLLLTALLAALGLPGDVLRWIAILALAVFGLALLVPAFGARLEPLFGRLAGMSRTSGGHGFAGGLALGAMLGVVWAPCVGPIMAAVIVIAATQQVTPVAVAITLAYVAGAAIPLLAIAYGGRAVLARLRRALGPTGGRVPQALGVLMLGTCLLLALGLDLRLQTLAGSYLPVDWTARLTALEDQPAVRKELDAMHTGPNNDTPSAANTPVAAAQAPAANEPPAAPVVTPPAAPTDTAVPRLALPDLGLAKELRGTGQWFNSPPTTLEALRGKVVVLNFWTFGCYNCVNTLPYIKSWHDKYADQGLVILGVHTPEFGYEKVADNVAQAIEQKGIMYPVVQDNDFQTWRAYDNRYWPAFYFIDAQGHIRHTHWGEGRYAENEQVIQQLLAEARMGH
jgi:cytochrome c biogenesis protein CcdA/thiol-disulfide isomerase/thioredoxin